MRKREVNEREKREEEQEERGREIIRLNTFHRQANK